MQSFDIFVQLRKKLRVYEQYDTWGRQNKRQTRKQAQEGGEREKAEEEEEEEEGQGQGQDLTDILCSSESTQSSGYGAQNLGGTVLLG